jgi:hypothetical protein
MVDQQADKLRFQGLDVYRVALDFARLVHEARIGDAELRDQGTRSAKSAFLQLSEGLPLDGEGIRRKYFTESTGSLCEALFAVDLAVPSAQSPRRRRSPSGRSAFASSRCFAG